jgi:hypothetical protein
MFARTHSRLIISIGVAGVIAVSVLIARRTAPYESTAAASDGFRIPMPRPSSTTSSAPAPAFQNLTATNASPTTVTLGPPDIPPDVAAVFDAMDKRFEQSKQRTVVLVGRLEMVSSFRGFREQFAFTLNLKWPNFISVLAAQKLETNDPATTTGWTGGTSRWWLVSDGQQMVINKMFRISQAAPKTIDEMIEQQIEIENWGENPLINCFLRTHPSTAFKSRLKRARVLERNEKEIKIELVSAPTMYLEQRSQIPLSFNLVQELTIDAPTSIPRRLYADLLQWTRDIYRLRGNTTAKVESSVLEVIVQKVDLAAPDIDPELFKIPAPQTTTGTAQTPPMIGTVPASPTTGPVRAPSTTGTASTPPKL